jgi:DNA repair exonuclease SbcCD nuclease subunit
MVRFIHTADWHLGKPYSRVQDPKKNADLQRARLDAVRRVGSLAREHQASFVVVAGDLFDTSSVSRATVVDTLDLVGGFSVPVLAIPGNHDHGGAGSIWTQPFFLAPEQQRRAPNLRVLLAPKPEVLEQAVILPCPLVRRHEQADPAAWLAVPGPYAGLPPHLPRVALLHGATAEFTSAQDDDGTGTLPNRVHLERLAWEELDYVALGDWHGTKQVHQKAWYAGTPEVDRFPKDGDHDPGNILVVDLPGRGQPCQVERVRTSTMDWHTLEFPLVDDGSIPLLDARLQELVGARSGGHALELTLTGDLGLEGHQHLTRILESLDAGLPRLDLNNLVTVKPREEEMARLRDRAGDPLVSAVAAKLLARANGSGPDAQVASLALRKLHAALNV